MDEGVLVTWAGWNGTVRLLPGSGCAHFKMSALFISGFSISYCWIAVGQK
jgi:hypothetical protein